MNHRCWSSVRISQKGIQWCTRVRIPVTEETVAIVTGFLTTGERWFRR
jgi:hypothetical protein